MSETTRSFPPPPPPLRPDTPEEERLPRPFGKYDLYEGLGRGGMAFVYRAWDSAAAQECAVKVPQPTYRTAPYRALFREEARALASLAAQPHVNLCGLLEHGEIEGIPFLAMPFIRGEPLSAYCAPGRPLLTPANVAQLIHTLAAAMEHAHTRGVIHRDLKPQNIIITPEGEPVVVDFGLAQSLTDPAAQLLDLRGGTLNYLPPEVLRAFYCQGPVPPPSPTWDVYALGVIMYQLLTGSLPFPRCLDRRAQLTTILETVPPDPAALQPEVTASLSRACLTALSRDSHSRFESMGSFARAVARAVAYPSPEDHARPPRVPLDRVTLAFVPVGTAAPPSAARHPDQLYLDVGNALRSGVIDHHHLLAYSGSTTRLVHTYPDLLDASLEGRGADDPFTLVLHEWPDLDAVASAFLAREYLCQGRFPSGAASLVEYVDWVDRGALGATRSNPFSLYCAYQVLAHRGKDGSGEESWQACARDGLALLGHVLGESEKVGCPLAAVDALAVPGLFHAADRAAVADDLGQYERILADPRSRARRVRLCLPDLFGGSEEADLLLVGVSLDEPERCLFLKDWARGDTTRCPKTRGFGALATFYFEKGSLARCILSVRPGGRGTLRGLGARLDQAEGRRRRELYGVDDREVDPDTRAPRTHRPGYPNADPWYDGRAHRFTIVDSPHGGTKLTEADIEQEILTFGACTDSPELLVLGARG